MALKTNSARAQWRTVKRILSGGPFELGRSMNNTKHRQYRLHPIEQHLNELPLGLGTVYVRIECEIDCPMETQAKLESLGLTLSSLSRVHISRDHTRIGLRIYSTRSSRASGVVTDSERLSRRYQLLTAQRLMVFFEDHLNTGEVPFYVVSRSDSMPDESPAIRRVYDIFHNGA